MAMFHVVRTVPRASRCLLPLLLVVAAGCKGIAVQAAHDPQADFSRLRTFDWHSVPVQAQTAVADVSLVDLIGAELTAHGLQRNQQDPDLLVAVHRSLEGQLNTRGWGYEEIGGRMRQYTYQEGTLVIDLVDAKSRRSVWRGTASGAFKFSDDPVAMRDMMTGVLRDMFADFPPAR
jgi:hypothetical protein